MGVASDECASLRFSTREVVERERLPFWRDFFCRQIVQVDIEPKSDLPISADVSLISCLGLKGMWAQTRYLCVFHARPRCSTTESITSR